MKKLTLLAVCLFGSLAMVSCDDNNNPEPPVTEGKAKMILAIDMAPQASMGYVVPVQNIAEGNVSFSNAHEVKSLISPHTKTGYSALVVRQMQMSTNTSEMMTAL